ncbi:MAG: VWA domain-containing protein [Deltaproteobacteria bacterium]|nr:VWA domain-containing protein [Deltaproteobacteria bacterium]
MRTLSLLLVVAAALLPACTRGQAHAPPTVNPEPVEGPTVAEPVPAVELELISELANRYVRADAPGEVLARIRINSPASVEGERPRANVGLVIDTSASMRGDAIVQARQAALTMLDTLRDGDVLSVVAFGSTPEVLVPATVLDAEVRPGIQASIETMKAWGTTDLAGGLQAGIQQVGRYPQAEQINRIVLLSDGVPNEQGQVVGAAQQARSLAMPITTLGLGLEYHEDLLGKVAQLSGGGFHFVEEPAAVATVFQDEVLRIDRLAARNPILTLTPGPGVEIVDVPGMGVGRSGRSTTVGLPDLVEGASHQIIVRLSVTEHRDGATVELLDGVLDYVDARLQTNQQGRTFVAAEATADRDAFEQGANLEVALAATRATTAAATLQVVSLARSGHVKAARAKLDQTVARAKALSKDNPDTELARLIDDLVELRPNLPGLAPPPPPKVTHRDKGKSKQDRRQPQGMGSASSGGQPQPQPAPVALSDEGNRSVKASHARAYQMLNGG